MIKKRYFYGTIASILFFSSVYFAWAVVSGESLMNVQDSTISGSLISPRRIKDAGNISDAQTSGLLSSGIMMHNGTNWDKIKGDTTNGLWVNVKALASSTITANQGTANTQANRWPVYLTDGTNPVGTATNAIRTDPVGTTAQPVTGTFWQATQPVKEVGSSNFANLDTTTTAAFANTAFGFTSNRIVFTNDSLNTIQISFDAGVTNHGNIKAGESFTFDNLAKTQLAIKSTAGGDAFRWWVW